MQNLEACHKGVMATESNKWSLNAKVVMTMMAMRVRSLQVELKGEGEGGGGCYCCALLLHANHKTTAPNFYR